MKSTEFKRSKKKKKIETAINEVDLGFEGDFGRDLPLTADWENDWHVKGIFNPEKPVWWP